MQGMSEQWHIIGAGAIGGWLAAQFDAQQLAVTLLTRGQHNPTLTFTDLDGSTQQHQLTAEPVQTKLPPIRNLIIATKAHQVLDALASVAHRIDTHTRILLLQNGMGFEQACLHTYPQATFMRALITHGAYRQSPQHIVYAGAGEIFFGPLSGQLSASEITSLLAPFNQCGLHASWVDDLLEQQWYKLAINAAINPLSALFNCANGELLKQPNTQHWLHLLIKETDQVLSASGLNYPPGHIQALTYKVAKQTANNFSSMHQDVSNGRSTEIDFINGFLLDTARQLGLDLPTHAKIYTCIKKGLQPPAHA